MEIHLVAIYVTIGIVSFIVYYIRKQLSYWKDRGIPHIKTEFIYGNLKGVGKTRHLMDPINEAYNTFKGQTPFAGVYMMLSPAAVITDFDLIKNILIKDFQKFSDRATFTNERDDPLSGHLFNLSGDKWKSLRKKLTPTFTSGKMKFMYPTILGVADEFIKTFDNLVTDNCNVEIKEIVARFTTDVIGVCAFGIDCNSLKDPNAEIRVMGKKAIFTNNHNALVESLMVIFPNIAKFFKMRITSTDVHHFFLRTVRDTVEYREKNNIQRNDFMNLLIEMRRNGDLEGGLTLEELSAQAFVFFLAGFETSSSTMCFCLYELAQNQDVQDRLRQDIHDTLERHDNKLTYECIRDMKYLEMVLYETLRKYPVVAFLNRLALSDYEVPNSKLVIEKGTSVFIPVSGIQHNPEVYPNPEAFIPERFTREEVDDRPLAAWLPFGDGPRNCIGLRFGKMQAYVGLAMLLKKFKFTVSPQTDIPLKQGNKSILIYHDGGIVLNVERV